VNYSYLDHVEYEILGNEDEIGEEAEDIMKDFFQDQIPAWNRAISDDSLRYFIVKNGDGVEIIEEEGDWQEDELDTEGNSYELIYEENGSIRSEEISAEEAEAYLL
jgi:endo-alpha-1,4-polygalactosaminidase (GH114 family)